MENNALTLLRSARALASALVVALAPWGALAQAGDCAKADAAVDRVTTWPALAQAVKDYRACDKGQTAELFTEALLRVVVGGWPKIAEAEPVFSADSSFRDWALRRLRSPDLPKDEAESVRDLAKGSCPKGREKLCADLAAAAEMSRASASPDLIVIPPATPKGNPK